MICKRNFYNCSLEGTLQSIFEGNFKIEIYKELPTSNFKDNFLIGVYNERTNRNLKVIYNRNLKFIFKSKIEMNFNIYKIENRTEL